MPKKRPARKLPPRKRRPKKPTSPKPKALWNPGHGITHSALGKFNQSPELFSIGYLDGKRPRGFITEIEYGNLHHLLDEYASRNKKREGTKALDAYVLARSAGLRQDQKSDLNRMAALVKALYPVYAARYRKKKIKWIGREIVFDEPYTVPSSPGFPSASINLTGKRDGLYETEDGTLGLWEVKTKGRIQPEHLQRQLQCDSQVLYYLHATLLESKRLGRPLPTEATYDVLKRPGLVQGKKETLTEYVKRVVKHAEEHLGDYFLRLPITGITESVLLDYEQRFLRPDIRRFLAWWRTVEDDPSAAGRSQSPFHTVVLSALVTPYDLSPYYPALVEGRDDTLRTVDHPFPELFCEIERAQKEAGEDAKFANPASLENAESALDRLSKKSS